MSSEIPIKAIDRGYSWVTIPITWRSPRTGTPKLKIKEIGRSSLFIYFYAGLEKYLSRGDYRRVQK
jgi:dolichol-phosphate mannosyltransferase